MNLKPLISCDLSPTTKNLLAILERDPVIILKGDSGSNRSEKVFRELRAMSGDGFRVFEDGDGICVVREGSARSFLI